MWKLILSLFVTYNSLMSLCLFYSASQRYPQVNQETEQLTMTTGGRQVSIVAPSPTAGLQLGLGFLSAGVSIGCAVVLAAKAKVAEEEESEDAVEDEGAPVQEEEVVALEEVAAGPAPFFIPPPPVAPPQAPQAVVGFSSPFLDKDNHKELNQIFNAGCIYVIAPQGSGKTIITGGIIAARLVIGHRVIVFNHHAAFQQYAPLKVYGRVAGEGMEASYEDICSGLQELKEEVDRRYTVMRTSQPDAEDKWPFNYEPWTVIIEEFSSYGDNLPDKDLLRKIISISLQECRKASIYFVFVTHALNASYSGGGVTGTVSQIKQSAPKIFMGNKPAADGGMRPSGYCDIEIPGSAVYKKVRVPDMSKLLPNPKRPLDFTSLIESQTSPEERLLEYARGRSHVTLAEAVEHGFAKDESEARAMFVTLGRQGRAFLNKDFSVMHLTEESR